MSVYPLFTATPEGVLPSLFLAFISAVIVDRNHAPWRSVLFLRTKLSVTVINDHRNWLWPSGIK